MSKNIKEEILAKVENLIVEYEDKLGFLKNRSMNKYDATTLPSTISKMLKLATTQAPDFSNVASITTATYVLAHMFGQLRPTINDPAYSQDAIVPNFYAIIIAPSGASKDLTYRALNKTALKGLKYATDLKESEDNEKALAMYVRKCQKDNPSFDIDSVKPEDYIDQFKPKQEFTSDMESTRGGIAKQLGILSRGSYGVASIFESELGMAIQSSGSSVEVLTLFSKLFDMGSSTAASYKSDEAREQSISGMFPNFLGISSPTPFYQPDGPVRKVLVPTMETALARRIVTIFSSLEEDYENMYIPGSYEEEQEKDAKVAFTVASLTTELQDILLKATQNLESDKSIMMDDDTAKVYRDYKGYNKRVSQRMVLRNGESVESLELAGRAWKCLRIAALWSLAEDSRMISRDLLISAIYFTDYTAQHLTRFSNAMKLEEYQLFISDWEAGLFHNDTLPIDQAIDRGYITSVTSSSIQSFLKPVNSRLKGIATVLYNEVSNEFVFTSIVQNTSDLYTYRAEPGHSQGEVTNVSTDKPVDNFAKLLIMDASFNPFESDSTKLIVLETHKSLLSMQMINKYLINTTHFITTRQDSEDSHTFTLVLPVSSEVSREEYKYMSMSIATQLMLHVLPESCESTKVFHSYEGATCLTANATSSLYDISGLKGQYASGAPVTLLSNKPEIKPTLAQITKYYKTDIEVNHAIIIDMINTSSTPLLLLASFVYDMKAHWCSDDLVELFVDTINASLEESIINDDKINYLIEPFKGI